MKSMLRMVAVILMFAVWISTSSAEEEAAKKAEKSATKKAGNNKTPAMASSDYEATSIIIDIPKGGKGREIEMPLFELRGGAGYFADNEGHMGVGGFLKAGKVFFFGSRNSGFRIDPGVEGVLHFVNNEVAFANVEVSALALYGVRIESKGRTDTVDLSAMPMGLVYIKDLVNEFQFLGVRMDGIVRFSSRYAITNRLSFYWGFKFFTFQVGEGKFLGKDMNFIVDPLPLIFGFSLDIDRAIIKASVTNSLKIGGGEMVDGEDLNDTSSGMVNNMFIAKVELDRLGRWPLGLFYSYTALYTARSDWRTVGDSGSTMTHQHLVGITLTYY